MNKNNLSGKKNAASQKRQSKEAVDKITPKLFVSGRLDRKKQNYTAKSLILLTSLENEIKTYCRGGELAILNYLIKEGLKNIKESNLPIHADIAELENNKDD